VGRSVNRVRPTIHRDGSIDQPRPADHPSRWVDPSTVFGRSATEVGRWMMRGRSNHPRGGSIDHARPLDGPPRRVDG
jgi:hypothetical protein